MISSTCIWKLDIVNTMTLAKVLNLGCALVFYICEIRSYFFTHLLGGSGFLF